MKKKQIFFTAINGDIAGETSVSILSANNFPVHLFNPEEIRVINGVLFVVFFTPKDKSLLGGRSNINPAAYYFLNEKLKEKEISDFLIACNPDKLNEMSFASAIINIATRYFKWWEDGCDFSNNNFFPPWGSAPNNYSKKVVFEKWLKEIKLFW